MAFDRIAVRALPDGSVGRLFPFHVSMEGLEKTVICREDGDYDFYVKNIFVCARRKNVIVVMYVAVSNHGHAAVLAQSLDDAVAFGEEVKKIYGMYFRRKYGKENVLRGTDVNVQLLNDRWHVRNVLAYIPRNALDNLSSVHEYRWSGFRGMFCGGIGGGGASGGGSLASGGGPLASGGRGSVGLRSGDRDGIPQGWRRVSELSKREREAVFRTHDDLTGVPWLINERGELEPVSACDCRYLEEAFNNDQAFFLKTIGSLNMAEMDLKLVSEPRMMLKDSDFLIRVDELSESWFGQSLEALPMDRKIRVLTYMYRTRKTIPGQLARVFGIDRRTVELILKRLRGKGDGEVQ